MTRNPHTARLAQKIANKLRDMEARFVQHGYADGLSEAMHAILRRVEEGCLDEFLGSAVVSEETPSVVDLANALLEDIDHASRYFANKGKGGQSVTETMPLCYCPPSALRYVERYAKDIRRVALAGNP